MATSSQAPRIKPGLLLTHDWSQLHTEKGLCDTTITKTDGQDYSTIIFPITRLSQYEAFVSGQVLCQDVIGCPLQSIGTVPQSEFLCHDKPLSAVVKVIYQVTHTLSADQDSSLSADAITSLQKIDNALGQTQNVPKPELDIFLQTYGSHFQYGRQQFGKAFSWMVVFHGKCDMNLLHDISNEIFTVCQERAALLPASNEGLWYGVQNLLNSVSWSVEKKQILESLKLRVAQCGSSASNIDYVEWKSREIKGHVFRDDGVNTNVISVWNLVHKSREQFKNVQNLQTVMKNGWRGLLGQSRHQEAVKTQLPKDICLLETCKPPASRHEVTPDEPEEIPDTCKPSAPPQEVTPDKPEEIPETCKPSASPQEVTPDNPEEIPETCKPSIPPQEVTPDKPEEIPETCKPSASPQEVTPDNPEEIPETCKPSIPPQEVTPDNPEEIPETCKPSIPPQEVTPDKPEEIPETCKPSVPPQEVTPDKLEIIPDTCKPSASHLGPHQEVISDTPEEIPGTCKPSAPPQKVEETLERRKRMAPQQEVITKNPGGTPQTCKPVAPQHDLPKAQTPIQHSVISKPWSDFVSALGMEKYFPGKLSLQEIRAVQVMSTTEEAVTKKELPWKVLEQIMFMNSRSREEDINRFATTVKPKQEIKGKKFFRKSRVQTVQVADQIPHPMDMILLLFASSDYMFRQVLARKLFMCRLAIPFIIPTATNTVEMMMWPLRSIILEWKDSTKAHEDALVNCKFNMVAFMRYGKTKFSKSSLMNDVLSSTSHATFFHKGSPCGNEKRLVSNGTVEMTHFLPGDSPQDIFKDPALFFNLRGDACAHPVQHSIFLDLATVLVICVDIGELRETSVQEMLKATTKEKHQRVSIVLTDSTGYSESDMEQLYELFCETVGDPIEDLEEDMVTTYSTDDGGGTENISTVIQDVRNVISKKMVTKPEISLEQYALSHLKTECDVDEISNGHCSAGKRVAHKMLTEMHTVGYLQRKKVLLPQQGPCLTELGELLRKLHRTSAQDKNIDASGSTMDEITKKESLKSKMKKIRMDQAKYTWKGSFMDRVIELLSEHKETRVFAIRFVQMELDSNSRSHLPDLQRKKNENRAKLAKAKGDENAEAVKGLQSEIQALEENIAAATFGWEHLMREIGQIYEVSSVLKNSRVDVSFLPNLVASQLLEGHPIELMNGDHGVLPLVWVKAVFQSLSKQAGGKKIFVVSVVGIQSSGKSTLLNTVFGLEFAVSAGRCTRGIYAQLLPVKENQNLKFDYMLVLDSEGLRSQQRDQNYQHDNELATLVIGLSDLALVNMKGENVSEMVDVLQIVVHAFLRMKLADSHHKRQCMVIHQNVAAVNTQEKLADDRQRLEDQLNTMTKQASIAQGLAECITSFNRIIRFDSEQDVVYFSDLWHGDPPMATINQGYSLRAANTQQRILQDIQTHFTNAITIPDFITRVEDMWKGVLSDDFIFSFRNTLAAKAYIEVEKEFAAQTFEIEQELLKWMATHCKVQIRNCQSEKNLHKCCGELTFAVKMQVDTLVKQKVKVLHEFFENHSSSEIIAQWKSEKVSSLRTFGDTQERQTEVDLTNMKEQKLVELHQRHKAADHEKEIVKKAIELAESMRGKHPSEEELQTQFDELWENFTSNLPFKTSRRESQVMIALQSILCDKFYREGGTMYFSDQTDLTPLKANDRLGKITEKELIKDYIRVKESKEVMGKLRKLVSLTPSRSNYFDQASHKANHIMETVMQRVEEISKQDAQFKPVHGREIIDLLWKEIDEHNNLPFDKAEFAITPEFKALLAVRVTSSAISKFEQMNQRFEDQYGVEAQMKAYKRRVFLLFQNYVKQASAEVIASGDFCEALKRKIAEYVLDNVKQDIPATVHQDLGDIKFHLIIKMLDEIAQEGSFTSLHGYALNPTEYAEAWLSQYCKKHLFTAKDGKTKYGEIACRAAENIFLKIASSASNATKAVSAVEGTEQYDKWIEEFCSNMKNTIPVASGDLKVDSACEIKSIENFHKFLQSDLEQLKEAVRNDFEQKTSEQSTQELHSTYQKIFQRLWGCHDHCPFCKEPCRHADQNHKSPHQCVQHKPSGVRGIAWSGTSRLCIETCNWDVDSDTTFTCGVIGYQCRETANCSGGQSHEYRQYKKYIPNWDIAPDRAGEACKYWQWAICNFKEQLSQEYPDKKLDIPGSWTDITKQEAIDSLRVYR